MTDSLTMANVQRFIDHLPRRLEMEPEGELYLPLSDSHYADLLRGHDPYGIIAQRRALRQAGVPVEIERQEEWWR